MLLDGGEDFGGDAVAPFGVGGGFLMDRDAFGEPAGHQRIGEGERKDVAHFVPERGVPVESAGLAPGWAIEGDGGAVGARSERDAEGAQAGHA